MGEPDACLRRARAGQAGGPFKDGGLADRTGLVAWRKRREAQARAGKAAAAGGAPAPPAALVHLIARSSRFSGADDVEATGAPGRRAVLLLLAGPVQWVCIWALFMRAFETCTDTNALEVRERENIT